MANGPTTIAGALFPPGAGTRVQGGWKVSGRVPFGSGCQDAAWLGMPFVEIKNGQPVVDPASGQPVVYGALFPRKEAEILDTWHTMGMRGTGSTDFALRDVFIPERRSCLVGPMTNPAPGFEGPIFRVWPLTAVLGEATVSVGVAAAAVDELVKLAATKSPAYSTTPLKEQTLAQHAAGKALGRVNAARDTLHRAAAMAYDDDAAGGLLSTAAKLRVQVAVSFAAEACAEAVRLVHEAAGSSAIRLEFPFERHFRDAHVLTQHSSKSSPRYASAGRLMFGLPNDWVWLSF
jgi:alkylation response protein AidB-like acyl-CoA dehydrogenase